MIKVIEKSKSTSTWRVGELTEGTVFSGTIVNGDETFTGIWLRLNDGFDGRHAGRLKDVPAALLLNREHPFLPGGMLEVIGDRRIRNFVELDATLIVHPKGR